MNHASCARPRWTQITTCDQTEGRNLSTYLDLCVSFVTQKISQNGLRIVTSLRRRSVLAVQATGDPAFDSGEAARSHHKRCLIHGGAARTRHDDAMPGKRLLPLHPRVCPLLSLAVLPTRTARTSGSFPMLPGSKPTLVLLWAGFTSRACTCRASGGGFGAVGRLCTQRLHRCFLHCCIAVPVGILR